MANRKFQYSVPQANLRIDTEMRQGYELAILIQSQAPYDQDREIEIPVVALEEVITSLTRLADYYRPGTGHPGPAQGTLF